MTRDILVNENLRTEYDDVGDIATVDGESQIEQSIVISIIESGGLSLASLTPDNVEEHRGDIRQAVRNNDFTEEPVTVTVESIDGDERTVTFGVRTERVSLELTVDA